MSILFSIPCPSLVCWLLVCVFARPLSIWINIFSFIWYIYLDSSLFSECEMDSVSSTMKMSNVTFGISASHLSLAVYSMCVCVRKKHSKCTVQFTRQLFSLTWHLILPSAFHLINFAFISCDLMNVWVCVSQYFSRSMN